MKRQHLSKVCKKLKLVLELPVVQASDVARVVLDIASIKSAIKIFIDEIPQECADLYKKGSCTSVLRAGSKCFKDVKSFNWNMVLNELLKRAACAKTWTGPWTVDHGLWTMDCGLWTVDYGLWTMDCGLWTMDYGLWTVTIEPS